MVYRGGVPNLFQVDMSVWRSGQITTAEGWRTISELAKGRRVHVLKLNFDHEGSDALAVSLGFDVHVLAIDPAGDQDIVDDLRSVFRRPNTELVDQAVALLVGAGTGDVWLVHCTHGQDRTGYIIGRYRVLHNGWTTDEAYREMLSRNFHPALHGVHEAWEDFATSRR